MLGQIKLTTYWREYRLVERLHNGKHRLFLVGHPSTEQWVRNPNRVRKTRQASLACVMSISVQEPDLGEEALHLRLGNTFSRNSALPT